MMNDIRTGKIKRVFVYKLDRISKMLRNPVYVEADIDVYQFFQSQGANIYNPASDFTGYNACYPYKGTVHKDL